MRRALVTGASRGIGAAIARAFATEQATVAVNYLRNGEAANEVVQECRLDPARHGPWTAPDLGALADGVAGVELRRA